MKRTNWFDLRSSSIKIDGDVALIHFQDNWLIEKHRGDISPVEFKKFPVFRKKIEHRT